ncbi:MAG: hypothetical protein ACPGQV_05135 [Alphaproteobacteria bacterium]
MATRNFFKQRGQDFIHIAFWHPAGTSGFVTAATVFEYQDADIGI